MMFIGIDTCEGRRKKQAEQKEKSNCSADSAKSLPPRPGALKWVFTVN